MTLYNTIFAEALSENTGKLEYFLMVHSIFLQYQIITV